MRTVFLSVLFASMVFAGTVTQSDWSGGPDVQGPVSEWEDYFWVSNNTEFNDGKLELSSVQITPVEHAVSGVFDGAISVYSSDLDGDGDVDIMGAGSLCDKITWWENTEGTGTVWTEHTVDGDFDYAASIFSADVDGDGDADILGAGSHCDDITWWENTDGTGMVWEEHIVDGDYDGAISVYSNDLDGDGDLDILGAGSHCDDITWWENTDGAGTVWIEHTVDGDFDFGVSVFSADVDGDGDADVLGAGWYCSDITWWENTDGTGTVWSEHTIDEDFDHACSVYCTDVDGDGDADVLGAGAYENEVTWWENNDGVGTVWTEHTIKEEYYGARSVYSTDIDCDGDADVLGAGYICSSITWWENIDGNGETWTEHTVDGDVYGAVSVYSMDVDGDGNMDILGAVFDEGDVTWWEVLSCSPVGSLESSILDAVDVSDWGIFLSNSQEPAGTSVSFQFRSSDDYSSMGAWSDTVFSPDTPLSGILTDSTRYLQYKVILKTSGIGLSPELAEVAFSYTSQVSVGETGSDEVPSWSLNTAENPSHGFFSALVSVPMNGLVELSLYDVSGRVVAEVSQELPAGTHSVNFTGLAQGVYFCTMRAGAFSATERIVVLK